METQRRVGGSKLAVILWCIGLTTVHAGTYYVAPSGSDGTGNGSSATPWRSVTNAVAHVSLGDVIQVAGGVYTQNVVMATTNVTIQGGYNAADWTWSPSNQITAIVGTNGSPVTFMLGTTNTLRYLTLRGGNKAAQAGVVLNATNCNAVIDGCVITGNTYGVYIPYKVQGANLVMRNTLVARNSSYGIYAYTYDKTPGTCWLYNCTIADNKDSGYYAYSVNSVAGQLLVASNTLVTGNAGFGAYMSFGYSSPSTAANSLFYGNARGPWNQYFRDDGGNKFSQDPKYNDAAHSDYRLQPSSPAAASGADLSAVGVTNDIQNVERPGPNGWDMGAYQGSGTGAPPTVGVAYVSKSGSDGTGDGSTTNPWASVTYGLGCLNATGTLYVASGVYTDNVWLGEGKRAIRGGYNPSDWSWDPANQRTVIDGCVTNPPVTVLSWRSTNTLIGLTLRNGLTTSGGDDGAGLRMSGWSNGTTGCVVSVDACTIMGNTYGIQDRALWATLTVRNTLITGNTNGLYDNIPYMGGGKCMLLNCTVANNNGHGCNTPSGKTGGHDNGPLAIYATNTLFTGNKGYGISRQQSQNYVVNAAYSLFYGNASGPWDMQASDGGHNKMWLDPAYVNAATNDYRLQSASPAAAAGKNLSAAGVTNDILAVARPGTYGWDMGAYQGSSTGAPPLLATAYVSKSGSDSAGDGSPEHPWASISYGIGRLTPTGVLRVASGIYTDNVWLGDSAMTIRGGYNPADWNWTPGRWRTTIFGNTNFAVTLYSSTSTNALQYLTLTGGGTNGAAGIQIYAPAPSCMLIADGCTITGNTYGVQSGSFDVRMILRNCLIANNSSNGIHMSMSYSTLAGFCQLANCTVANNGGNGCYSIKNTGCPAAVVPVVMTNTLVTGNRSSGLYLYGNSANGSVARYSLFYGNSSGAWSTNALGFVGSGSTVTNQDPLYANVAAGDYRLASPASPAYNTGIDLSSSGLTNDLLGVSRPKYDLFDRGACEYWIPPPTGSAIFLR